MDLLILLNVPIVMEVEVDFISGADVTFVFPHHLRAVPIRYVLRRNWHSPIGHKIVQLQ